MQKDGTQENHPVRAIALLSGGLDSTLAVRLLQEQGIEVIGYTFVTPFFGPESAQKARDTLGIRLEVLEITDIYMEMMKAPKYGFGKNMNPCIDCHGLMFRLAGDRLAQEGADFLCSGEVLGERPFSQNRKALGIVARLSGREELILRPLSAKCLAQTLPERQGWVDRSRLGNIQGRSRRPQMAMAQQFGITDYPKPAGGCRLTEISFAGRLKDLLQHTPDPEHRYLEMLKIGRHIRWDDRFKMVVGRREAENNVLETLCRPGDIRLWVEDIPGPLVVLPAGGQPSEEVLLFAARVAVRYSDAPADTPVRVLYTAGAESKVLEAVACGDEDIQSKIL